MKPTPFLAGFGLAAVLLSLDAASPRFATAAPDDTLGMAIMAANVNAAGTLLAGSGVTNVTKGGDFDGEYRVDFNRDVSGCFPSATPTGALGQGGEAKAQVGVPNPNSVLVGTYSSGGVHVDLGFSLLMYCAK